MSEAITKTIRGGWLSRRHIRALLQEECDMRRFESFYVEDWGVFGSKFHITGPAHAVEEIIYRIEEWLSVRGA